MLTHSIHNKKFITSGNEAGRSNAETIFHYQLSGDAVHGSYIGGPILLGQLVGKVISDNSIQILFQCVTTSGELLAGRSKGTVALNDSGLLTLSFDWVWIAGESGGGTSHYVEIV